MAVVAAAEELAEASLAACRSLSTRSAWRRRSSSSSELSTGGGGEGIGAAATAATPAAGVGAGAEAPLAACAGAVGAAEEESDDEGTADRSTTTATSAAAAAAARKRPNPVIVEMLWLLVDKAGPIPPVLLDRPMLVLCQIARFVDFRFKNLLETSGFLSAGFIYCIDRLTARAAATVDGRPQSTSFMQGHTRTLCLAVWAIAKVR